MQVVLGRCQEGSLVYVSLRSRHQRQLLATFTPQELGVHRVGQDFSFSAPCIREANFRCQTSVTTVRAGLDAGGAEGLLGRQFGVCVPPFKTPAAVAGNLHTAGARCPSSRSGLLVFSSMYPRS